MVYLHMRGNCTVIDTIANFQILKGRREFVQRIVKFACFFAQWTIKKTAKNKVGDGVGEALHRVVELDTWREKRKKEKRE
jgi:hypothetical protein